MTTKEDLIKTDPELRPYQLDALLNIFLYVKCLVKMFCGTGKSRVITNVIIHAKKKLTVVVFPSLALISQYSKDYLNNKKYETHFKKYKKMNISSEKLNGVDSTTDHKEIKKFLNNKKPKIILVTYQSYHVLLECLEGQKIGLVCYDEAHHVTSPEYQKLVFFRPELFEKEVFFTATPRNENGITMYDRDGDADKNMCGELAYEYTYLQGLADEVLNAFQICIDMFTEDANVSLYEAMSRAILKRGTSRVLSFHSGVNGESNTNVWNFVNPEKFKEAFDKVQQSEFPEKKGYYKKFTFNGMDGNTPSKERETLLSELDNTPDNEIYIISSCETIGEGVDTKKANMCVFADPKSSITKIIQNIGRVVRPNKECPCSTILIPCFVDMEHYAAAQGDRVKTDELIREQMRATNGDYAPILNVLAALKQEDPELYDMCLNYPNKQHKEHSLNEQGYRIVEEEDDDYDGNGETYTSEEVEELKEDGETPLEIHTNKTIERFNMDSSEPLKRLYYDEEEEVFKPIVKMDDDDEEDDDEDDCSEIQPPKQKRVGMSIHHNSDIEILWGVKEELDFNNKFCSAVIDCEVVKIDPMEVAMKIVERAEERVANGERLLPKQYTKIQHKTEKQIQEKKDAGKLSSLKQALKGNGNGCKPPSEDVLKYLDENLPNWRYEPDKDVIALKEAENILHRSNLRKNENKNILPRDCQKGKDVDTRTPEEVQEQKDAWKLQRWRRYRTGGRGHICPDKVIKLLDESLPGWSECKNLDELAYKDAQNIIQRSSIRVLNRKNSLPKNHAKPTNRPDDRTEEQIQENKDAAILSAFKLYITQKKLKLKPTPKGRKCSNRIIKLLDESLPGWCDTLDDKAMCYAEDIVNRSNARKEKHLNVLPILKSNPILHDDIVEYDDAQKIMLWRNAVNGKGNSNCSEELQKYLDEHLVGWSAEQDHDEYALEQAKQIKIRADERVKNKKNFFPIRSDKPKGKDTRTPEQLREHQDATRMGDWKMAVNNTSKTPKFCPKEVIKFLDENMNGWREKRKRIRRKKTNTTNLKEASTPSLPPPPPPPPVKKNRKIKLVFIDQPIDKSPTTQHHFPPPSAIGELHKTYRRMRSDTLHETFKTNPQLWLDYHATREANLASYDPASIPSNIIIQKLEKIQTKRPKIVVDMGCGKAPIAHYFRKKNDKRFVFHNFDHQSGGDLMITEANIIHLPLENISAEIVIMSLVLSWGTQEDRLQYVKEAHRVLESGGKFYVIDTTKAWSPEPITSENGGELLQTLLEENGFKIISKDIGLPFCFFECNKVY